VTPKALAIFHRVEMVGLTLPCSMAHNADLEMPTNFASCDKVRLLFFLSSTILFPTAISTAVLYLELKNIQSVADHRSPINVHITEGSDRRD
jgi:hypothetical protein